MSGARRLRRSLLLLVVVVVVLVALFLGGGGWYFAGQIGSGALAVDRTEDPFDLRVAGVERGGVVLAPTGEQPRALDTALRYGLDWESGFGQVSGPPADDGDGVRRSLQVLTGAPPQPGQRARLDRDAFPADPDLALPVPVREVQVPGPLGPLPAWLAAGRGTTWVVAVHGHRAERDETLRSLRGTTAAGLPGLAISYRNDAGTRQDPSGQHAYGATEWRDLEAAVRYATRAGAQQVVLVGHSMGGSIVAAFLGRSDLADRVSGVVLEAPMLDLSATLDQRAAQRDLPVVGLPVPGALVWTAKRIAGLRYGLDLDEVDYLADPSWLEVPALVVHGADDTRVPVGTSERLDALRPDLVELVLVPGADHLEAWNVDPAGHERRLREFVTRVAPSRAGPAVRAG